MKASVVGRFEPTFMFHMIRDNFPLLILDRNCSELGLSIAVDPAAVTIDSMKATRGLMPHAGAKTADVFGEWAQALNQILHRVVLVVRDLDRILSDVVAESGQRALQRLQFKQAGAPGA